MIRYPEQVRIVEVSPRDGLQSEEEILSLEDKVEWIKGLVNCGYQAIEIGSLVNYKRVPQLQQTDKVFEALRANNKHKNCQFFVLIGNIKYLQLAIELGVKNVSLMCSASNTFSLKNSHRSLEESFIQLESMVKLCRQHNVFIRVYLSCSFDCPYEGEIAPSRVIQCVDRILATGCDEISLADTTGKATILQIESSLTKCLDIIPAQHLAVHFHNTYLQALANTLLSLQLGVINIDTSVGGLGGCPFSPDPLAPADKGNLSTESLLFMLDGLNIQTGVDKQKVETMKQRVFTLLKRLN